MKAAIISLESTSSKMVAEAMKKYFDQVDMLHLKGIEVDLGKEGGVFYHGKELEKYDCVYLKGSFRYANLLRSIATFLEGKVPYMPLPANAFTTVHNKLLTHLALQQHHLPMPKTYVLPDVNGAKELLKKVHYPIVMKFPEGTQGKGVMFADSFNSASSLLDALGVLKQPFIIQEYVETDGTDIRALVVGEKVVAAMKRKAQTEEKRANLHAGGVGESVQLSRASINVALDTAKALGVDICGVDILEGPTGPLVIEANISPGLQGLSAVSTIDIANEIARYLHYHTQRVLDGTKREETKTVMKEIMPDEQMTHQIITALQFRGERILLPDIVTKFARFSDRKEYLLTLKKGKVEIEESKR
ncbi:RimK family alpha-L-glutamate ligase [Candidatus Woesearchaeota archaeon]|nr:RimK family alpha-L-glutamate ligase [Candidatus Woesearchaeota archaeon]